MRRTELLDAALEVLRARDPEDVRVLDITQAAGAAKGTFYVYFASWNELLIALRDHLLSAYTAEMRARMATPAADWWTAFEQECVRFVDYIIDLGGLHKVLFHGPAAGRATVAACGADAVVAELLEAGIRAGACRPVDVEAAAPILFAVVHATADGIAVSGERERRIAAMLEVLGAWLRATTDLRQ